MNVVPIHRAKVNQTVELLEALTANARAGKIVGVALCYRRSDGTEECASSGYFATSPDGAAAAALRLSMRLAYARGEYDFSP